jgi:mortality factor 4-like protein 1
MKMESTKTSSDVSDNSNSSSSETEIENLIAVSPYAEGEKVLAYHTTCLYEAKVFFYSCLSFLYCSYLNLN